MNEIELSIKHQQNNPLSILIAFCEVREYWTTIVYNDLWIINYLYFTLQFF